MNEGAEYMSQTAQHTNETKISIVHMLMLKFGYSSCIIGLFLGLVVTSVNFYQWNGRPLSLALMVLVLITLVFQRARKYGLVISHIYAIILGLLSYAMFTSYLQNLGPEVFIKILY